jgi:hypothetical protein
LDGDAQMANSSSIFLQLSFSCKSNLCWCWDSSFGEIFLVFLPRRRIFDNDVCQTAKDVTASKEAFAEFFERIENLSGALNPIRKYHKQT